MVKTLQRAPGLHCSWSMLVVDELHLCKAEGSEFHSHTLRGSGGRARLIQGEPYLWAMSGTPFENGPRDMSSYVRYLEDHWAKSLIPEDVRTAHELCSAASLAETQDKIDVLMNKTIRAAKSDRETALGVEDQRLLQDAMTDFKSQLRHLMIRRTGESLGLDGKSLVPLPELSYDEHVSPLIDAEGQRYLDAYVEEVKNKLQRDFHLRKTRWIAGGRKGAEPIWPKHEFEKLQYQARPVCSFPELGRLKEKGFFPEGWNLDVLKTNGWFDKHCEDSPVKTNIQRLHDSSPKLKWIDGLVDEMTRAQASAFLTGRDEDGEKPKKEKLVIVTAFPINSLIIWEWLRHNNPNLKVVLYGSHVKRNQRQSIIDGFQETMVLNKAGKEWVHKETYHPDVIVGTIGVLGTGLTLHFARRLVIFEPQHVLTSEQQTMKRVHRIGQTRKAYVYRLIASTCKIERIIVNKLEMRKFIAKVVKPLSEQEQEDMAYSPQEDRAQKQYQSSVENEVCW